MKYRHPCAALALLGLLLGLLGCARTSPYGKGFRLPLAAEPLQLDPQIAQDNASLTVLDALMEGLTRRRADGTVEPAAAARWEISEDGCVYTFHLAEAVWQNGDPVTADDFVFGWQRAADPATRAPQASAFSVLAGAAEIAGGQADVTSLGVTATDAATLQVTLTAPDPLFLETVSGTAFFPCQRAFFESTGGRYGLEARYTLANGPFTLYAWSHGEYLILEKHETYRDAGSIAPSRVRYVVTEVSEPLAALQSGALDATALTAEQAAAAPSGITLTALQDSLYALWFNTAASSLDQLAIRKALRASVEYTLLDTEWQAAGQTAADGFLPPDTRLQAAAYRDTAVSRQSATDPEAARQLLQEALPDSSVLSSLTLLCSDDERELRIARYIVQSWQKHLGVYLHLTALPAATLEARVLAGNYELALYTHIGSSAQAELALGAFCSGDSANLSGLRDDTYDALWQTARNNGFTAAQAEALEERLWETCPCIPLTFPTRWFGTAQGVEQLEIHPFAENGGITYDFRRALRRE